MKRMLKWMAVLLSICLGFGMIISRIEKRHGKVGWSNGRRPSGFYEENVKRPLDFGLCLFALIVLAPLLFAVSIMVRIRLGSPVLFEQKRPGLGERIFTIRKFRSMELGEGSDEERLTNFGKILRSTSVDELPELVNILGGSMSIVGPRPQLIRDMVFMNEKHRSRYDVRPGLTGLAQVNGRNGISWEEKLDADLLYIEKITFQGDLKIVIRTIMKVLARDGINEQGQATALDYGDWLLVNGWTSKEEYTEKQKEAERILYEVT